MSKVNFEKDNNRTDMFYYNDNHDMLWGPRSNFSSEEDFVRTALEELNSQNEGEWHVESVKLEVFVASTTGLEAEAFIPLKETDVRIEVCYQADIYQG